MGTFFAHCLIAHGRGTGVRFLLAFLDPVWQKTLRQIQYISYHKTGKETTHAAAHISQSGVHTYKKIRAGKGGAQWGRAI